MSKKIGTFLMVMLVICAVLLLMATAGREPQPLREPTVTTAPTESTAPTEHTAPSEPTEPRATETEPAEDPTEPTEERTEPTEEKAEPPAETTAPTEAVTEPDELPEPEPQPTAPAVEDTHLAEQSEENLRLVRQILDQENLAKTARSHWVWDAGLNAQEGTTGTARASYGWALALIAAERKMNPIAAFLVLSGKGLYSKTEDTSSVLTSNSFAVPVQEAKQYEYTDAGARQLISDLLNLAGGLEDGLAIESGLLGANNAVDEGQVALARSEGCYYGYFTSGGDRSTHILCFYLRGDSEGRQIDSVEFQLLNLRSARGAEEELSILDRRGDTQAAALVAAAELLMTGQTQAGQGMLPFNRQVTSYIASIERFYVTGKNESGTLTNYQIKKK